MIGKLILCFVCVSFISFVAFLISWIIATYGYEFLYGKQYSPQWDDVIYVLKLTFLTSSVLTVVAWGKAFQV